MIIKATKKPVTVEVCFFDKVCVEKLRELERFLGLPGYDVSPEKELKKINKYAKEGMPIETLEGTMLLSFGDVLIKGVNGEFYPCKRDIFDKTYDYKDVDAIMNEMKNCVENIAPSLNYEFDK